MKREIRVLDLQGGKDSRMKTPPWLLIKINQKVLHQTVVYYEHLKNVPTSHTKTRGEVRGGGKKPWRQKGTGRARAGTLRSPIFRGGGIIFGPRPGIKAEEKIPKKIRRVALFMGLSAKLKSEKLKVIKPISIKQISTKGFFKIFQKSILENKNILLIGDRFNQKIKRSANNLPNFDLKDVRFINLMDILKHDLVVLSKETLTYLDEQANKTLKIK